MYRNFLDPSDITSTTGSWIPAVYNPLHAIVAHTIYHSPKRVLNNRECAKHGPQAEANCDRYCYGTDRSGDEDNKVTAPFASMSRLTRESLARLTLLLPPCCTTQYGWT